jgi:hypothetical protein
MIKFSISTYWKIKEAMDSMSADLLHDLSSEILSELFNGKYVTDEERVNGILEAIQFVTKVKTK